MISDVSLEVESERIEEWRKEVELKVGELELGRCNCFCFGQLLASYRKSSLRRDILSPIGSIWPTIRSQSQH